MFDTIAIKSLPEVNSTVLGDKGGALLECLDDADGETVAAVSGFTVTHLSDAGEMLGLGDLERVTLAGGQKASMMYLDGELVMVASIDPKRPLAGVEKKIDEILLSRGETL